MYSHCFPKGLINKLGLIHSQFLCGVTTGSERWLCCSLHVLKNALAEQGRPSRHPVPDDHGESLGKLLFTAASWLCSLYMT